LDFGDVDWDNIKPSDFEVINFCSDDSSSSESLAEKKQRMDMANDLISSFYHYHFQ